MLSTSPQSSKSSKSSQRSLRIDAIHHNMAHFISESTVHKYQYSIEHFPETSSLMTSGSGTNYDFSICSRNSHSSLSLKELQTLFPDAVPQALAVSSKPIGSTSSASKVKAPTISEIHVAPQQAITRFSSLAPFDTDEWDQPLISPGSIQEK